MPPILDLAIRPLVGDGVSLEPYAPGLRDEVRAALDCDPEAWSLFGSSGQGEAFDGWWSLALGEMARGRRIAYAIRDRALGRLVGTSAFLDIRPAHRGVEIGATFLRPEARGGAANPEAKRLMLAHAFDNGTIRATLLTDARNLRSQAAIAKLGAVREGVLRRERVTWTGHIRDTVVFSITDLEWPTVRAGLDRRLADLSGVRSPSG